MTVSVLTVAAVVPTAAVVTIFEASTTVTAGIDPSVPVTELPVAGLRPATDQITVLAACTRPN